MEKTDSLEALLAAFRKILTWVRDPGIRRAFATAVQVILSRLGFAGSEIRDLTDPEELMEWRDRVREEGELAGEALLLTRLLQLKFGSLDDTVGQRIADADAETLLRWGGRVLTADSLAEVFGDD